MLIIIFAVNMLGTTIAINTNQQRLDEAKIQIDKLTSANADLQKYNDMKQKIILLGERYKTAAGTSPIWDKLFKKIQKKLSDDVVIDSIICSYSGNVGAIVISGWSYEYSSISDTFDALKEIEELGDLTMNKGTKVAAGERKAIKFDINGVIVEGEGRSLEVQGVSNDE